MDNDSPISASARAKIRIRIKGVDYRMADQTAADIIASIAGTGARISGPSHYLRRSKSRAPHSARKSAAIVA